MTILLFLAIAAAPPVAASQSHQARPCSISLRGYSQVAYKPYGSALFGSDGVICATVKPNPNELRSARQAQQQAQRTQAVAQRVESGP